jgi:hypothetical protein
MEKTANARAVAGLSLKRSWYCLIVYLACRHSKGTVEQEQCDAGAAHLTHKFSPTYISSAGRICSNTTQISSPKSKPNISKNGWGA